MREITPVYIADHIRRVLKDGGSAPHSDEVQAFFQRRDAIAGLVYRRTKKICNSIPAQHLPANAAWISWCKLPTSSFPGQVLEEKVMAVFLLEKQTVNILAGTNFELFASWIDRVSSWADHDALVALFACADGRREAASLPRGFLRGRSRPNRWRRRAACVALIGGARERRFRAQIVRLSNQLLHDEDDMVQKGLGWLLREQAKADPKRTVPYLMRIRRNAPRLVLRTACETLAPSLRKQVLKEQRF